MDDHVVSELERRVTRAAGRLPAGRRVAQRHLARLSPMVRRIRDAGDVGMAQAVLAALEARPPRTEVSGPLLDVLERQQDALGDRVFCGRTLRGSAARGAGAFFAVMGLLVAAHYVAVAKFPTYANAAGNASLPDHWALVGLAGSAGAIVSLLSRWRPEDEGRSRDAREHAALNGFLRPVLGWLSGCFAFFVYFAGLVQTSAMPTLAACVGEAACGQAWATAYGLAFVAGFSERWVRDVATMVHKDDGDDAPDDLPPRGREADAIVREADATALLEPSAAPGEPEAPPTDEAPAPPAGRV